MKNTKNRILMFAAPLLLAFIAVLSADEPTTAPLARTVGSVYGRNITAEDIGLTAPIDRTVQFDARDEARWKQMGRVMTTFGGPVVDRFIKQHKIEATDAEVQKFTNNSRKRKERNVRQWEDRLAELKQQLAAPNLSEEDKSKLEKERAMYAQFIAASREPIPVDQASNLAKAFIVNWKVERELYRTYGGRVIHQQAGLEALDARRLLFEEAEKNGDLHFDDAGVRHFFYYYANMKHVFARDETALEKPWFFVGEN